MNETEALRAEVAELSAHVARLQEQLDRMATVAAHGGRDPEVLVDPRTASVEPDRSVVAAPGTPGPAEPRRDRGNDADGAAVVGRRRLLGIAGGGAAAAALGAAGVVATAAPAAAGNGDPLSIGTSNNGTNTTLLYDSGVASRTTDFLLVSDNSTPAPTSLPAAIAGYANNTTMINAVSGTTTNPNGFGVIGRVKSLGQGSGAGVYGDATAAGTGVVGVGITGVQGQSNGSGPGVKGSGPVGVAGDGAVGLQGSGTDANLRLTPGGPPAPSRPNGQPGEFVVDQSDVLWFCIAPGAWRKLCGPGSVGGLFVLDGPMRVYDSRPGFLPNGVTKGPFTPGSSRAIDCTLNGAVPAGATAVVVNLTVTDTVGTGFVAAYRNGLTWPGNSTVNWSGPNTNAANLAVVALDPNALIAVSASNTADVVVDVLGYYG